MRGLTHITRAHKYSGENQTHTRAMVRVLAYFGTHLKPMPLRNTIPPLLGLCQILSECNLEHRYCKRGLEILSGFTGIKLRKFSELCPQRIQIHKRGKSKKEEGVLQQEGSLILWQSVLI